MENKTMKAYKGFSRHEDGTLWCRSFQYEVGKTYTFEGEPVLCKQGFHACHEPWQCWAFYPNNGHNVYYEVECGGKIIGSNDGDGKFVCTEITLVKEISSPAPENKFGCCWYFQDGYARVELNHKYNYINTEGKCVFEQWFDWCGNFHNGYVMAELKGKWNFIDMEGKVSSEQWFDAIWSGRRFWDDYPIVLLNGKCNHISTDGRLLSEQWFDRCWSFQDGYAKVLLNGKYNYIDTKGKYLSEQWFDDGWNFSDGYARVWLNGKWHKIDKTGKIIGKMTQEERQLLLQDLCARLPYGVKISVNGNIETLDSICDDDGFCFQFLSEEGVTEGFPIENIKPYLRPMSSMSRDEYYEFEKIEEELNNHFASITAQTDWLIKNHFDHRGLIPMGLALEAPEDMYNLN